jgi:hypothetical protein
MVRGVGDSSQLLADGSEFANLLMPAGTKARLDSELPMSWTEDELNLAAKVLLATDKDG